MPFKEHLFISDIHLGAFSGDQKEEIEERLIALIDHAISNQSKLYILGDLFDYWMEYPDRGFVPEISPAITVKLREYNSTVTPALFITGNHDNWTFGYFKELGFDVENEYRIIELGDKKILLLHGDGYFDKEGNFTRPLFHRMLRNKGFIKVYQKLLSPKPGLGLMKTFSDVTRKRNYLNPKPLSQHAERILKQMNLDLVLSGHDHIPRSETFSHGRYINLGTFFGHSTMVRYNESGLDLVIWHGKAREFVPFSDNSIQV